MRRTALSWVLMWSMRRLILRRSVSSCVSPGPRVPMPPPSCDMARPRPARRGSWYSSCASSTWSCPSRVLAWRAKKSRISCERAMTGQGGRGLMLWGWRGGGVAGEPGFDVAELRGREVVVEENQRGVGGGHSSNNFIEFSLADEARGIGLLAALDEGGGNGRTG